MYIISKEYSYIQVGNCIRPYKFTAVKILKFNTPIHHDLYSKNSILLNAVSIYIHFLVAACRYENET